MSKNLDLSLDQLESIIGHFNTPFHIYDKNKIINHANNFMNTFRKYIPDFQQYFAVKALPNLKIMKILYDCGMGFDCSSVFELQLATQIAPPDKIVYTSNYTSVEDLEIVLKSKVIINLDDIDCLDNLEIALISTDCEMPELICFRLNPCIGTTDSETVSNILGGDCSKFGIPGTKIIEAYKKAQLMGFKKFGIHVMTGSCILDINYWRELIDIIFFHINKIDKELNIEFEFINLGGGIGIPYKPEVDEIDLEKLVQIISETYNRNIIKYDLKFKPNIVMENGRYITGPYGWLISRCKSIKYGYNDKKFYGLDSCMANLMRPAMYGAYHHITIPRLNKNKIDLEISSEEVNVVGTLCENNDYFAKNRKLPIGIKKNDLFVIHDTGAHGHCMGFQYNGKMRSSELLLIKDDNNSTFTVELIRKSDTYDSMVERQMCTGFVNL